MTDPPDDAPTSFDQLPLSDVMHEALRKANYDQPTPVQAGLIPYALTGKDALAQAQTGTGKTAAFCIPILERLQPQKKDQGPQAIVLVPTRELAVQVRGEMDKMAVGRRIRTVPIYGGKPIRQQIEKLRRGCQVIIGTPGRVLDHIGRRTLRLDGLTTVVLDEADRMLDIGFRPDIEKILRHCPKVRQTLFLSATVPPPIQRLAKRYMNEPEHFDFSPKQVAVETIEQFYFTVDPRLKFDLLLRLIQRERPDQAIIFCRTRRGTEKVFKRLSKKVKYVGAIHGDMPQGARDRTMANFRSKKIRLLAATDVVGRGIDVTSISHIINYDIPQFCDDYVHRVGRAGRMGREGVAFTLVTPEEGIELTRIEMRIDLQLKRDEIEGFHASAPESPVARPVAPPTSTDGAPPPEAEPEEPAEKPPPPFGGRRNRRRRRAL